MRKELNIYSVNSKRDYFTDKCLYYLDRMLSDRLQDLLCNTYYKHEDTQTV